jgi:membrane-associated phospholipid phosphatase
MNSNERRLPAIPRTKAALVLGAAVSTLGTASWAAPPELEGNSNQSFRGREAPLAAGLVTPYALEYGRENPETYGMLLLPLYVGVSWIKKQAHWQSDVIAGWAIGGLAGWYAHSRKSPIFLELLPDGFAVGYKVRF